MRELGDGHRFALEPRERVRVPGERGGEDFYGNFPIEPRIACAIDFAHATGAEGGEDVVWSQAGTGGQRHLRSSAS